jgi:CHASE3 domain sensor protein
MIVRHKFSSITLLVLLMLSLFFLSIAPVDAQTTPTASKLEAAHTAVELAFGAVLDAEEAGANVTDLMFRLNYIIDLLARAENSYRTGNINQASSQADNVLPNAQQITNDAKEAKQAAAINSENASWSTIALAVIGVFLFILVLSLIWQWFKQYYIERISKAKPEVVEQ